MTTPRDTIGLSERLREVANEHVYESPKLAEAAREAATQLDALSARVKELEAVNRLLDDTGDLLQARVKDLEAERDQMAEVLASPLADKVVEYADRATRAEQERDEAYERAAKEAEWEGYGSTGRAIAKAIRQIAAGDEEGKK